MENYSTIPLVSIIIPLYNCAEFIEECLNSILNQKVKDIEVIVVDDGSKDDGAKLVEKYQNIKLIQQSNSGVTAARKTGVAAARGEWIMFVDADDTVGDNILSSWLPYMREGIDFIIGKMPCNKLVTADELAYDIQGYRRFPRAPWLKLFRRELFEKSNALDIPREIVWGEDVIMLLRLCMVARGKAMYSEDREYFYREHPSQVTKTFRVTSDYERMYHKILKESIPAERIDFRFMSGMIRYRLTVYERILKESRHSYDDVRNSVWFKELKDDINNSGYRPSKWFRVLLRYGTRSTIKPLRSIKWIFKFFKAY